MVCHPKKGFPTNPMFPGDIPSYSPPSRAFFTPPLPRNYTNPFADKPTLRGTNSDSTIINTNTQQADQHDDFINDGEQMPDHYENPNFELKHHHRGEPPGGGPQYHDIMDNCYSEPINAPPYDTKSLRGNPGPPPPQPIHSQQNSRNYDFQNFERPSFDQAASSQSISRGEFRASKNLKTLKSGQAAAAAAAGGAYDGANTMGHHHYNHFNNYNDSFERRIGVRKSGTLNNIGHFNQHGGGGGGSGRNNNNSTSSASSSASSNNRAIAAQQAAGRPPRGGGHLNGAQTLGAGRADHHHHHHHHPQAAPRNLPPSEFPVHPGSFNDRLANGGGSQDGINNFDDNSSSAASGAGNYYHSKKRSRESSSSSYTGFNGNGAPGLEHGVPNDAGSSSPTASGSNVPINGLGGSSSGSSSGVLPGKMGPPPQQTNVESEHERSESVIRERESTSWRGILSGSNGRTQTIPDVLLRSVTSAPRPNQPTFDLNAGGLPAVTSLSNAKNLNKGEGDEDGDGFEGGNENSGSRDEGEEEDDDDDGGGDDEEDVVGEKIDGSFYSTASVATSTVSSAGGHPASSSSPITQKMPNLNLKSVMIKANASGEEVGGGYGNDRNFATDIEDISTWTIAWNIHVYLSAILFTILAVYSIFKIIFYDKLTHLFSQSYFISIHLILIIICLLRIFYLCYDAYNIHFSFNLFTSELLLNLPLTFLTTTFAILILFLLLRSINHKTNRYSSILRPLTIMIGSGVHVGLCVTLHLVESYETQQFYHKQTQLLSRGGAAGHGPTNIQIPPRVLSLICQIIYIFICLSLGILYLYMYRLLKRILHKSQNYIHGYNNLSYAIHITIATALLFILLAALQIYGAISISSQTKVKLSPANMNDAAAAKKTLWASHIEIDWFQWGYQFSLRFIEIVIIALLSWVTGLKTGTSKGVPREKDMEQPNASGFALFPCTSSSSQENFETDYPAVCNANTNLHTYTLRTGKPIYDDNFALNSLNLEQNSAQDLQPNDFQRSIETNSMRSSSHNYSNNYNGSQQADQHDDFINDGEQMPDHYENPNFELKHHHRGEPPGGGPQYHDIMDNCYSEPINAPPYDTKSLRGNPGPPPPQPIHSQQNSRNYDFQNFERPSFDQAASSQSISRGEFRASKNLKTLKSGQAAAAAAAGGAYDGANTMGHHHYNHFNNYNDSFERRIGVRKSGTLNNIGHFNQHGGGGSGRNNNNSTSSASSSASSNNRAIAAQQAAGRPPRGGGHLNGAQTLGAGRADHHHHHHHHPQAAPRNLPPSEFPVHPGSFNDRLANGGSQDGINNFDDNSSSAASGAGNYYHSKKRSRESSSSSYTGFNGNGAPGLEHGVPNDAGSSSPTASGSNVPINGLGGSSSGSSSGVLPGKMGPPPQQTNGDNSSMLVAEQGFVRFRALEEPALGSQRTALRDKNKLFMNS
ncbi:conserved hypothetical protein [Culex quinquefasciatus]|uniref:Proline-rich transmembrane protein 3/4 domain-containing protein n=1 Tax=Culex quinquefasciatus TaxID=7176 RepID=B0X3L0_CULQU|nr:conserved hypothetical protein [Culex quinquefasciatus]|eukprot:XP_001864232.1 conserved hypothetical protein [Culex quinquefasciatus]